VVDAMKELFRKITGKDRKRSAKSPARTASALSAPGKSSGRCGLPKVVAPANRFDSEKAKFEAYDLMGSARKAKAAGRGVVWLFFGCANTGHVA